MRDTEQSIKLSALVRKLMNEFCTHLDTPLNHAFIIEAGEQIWQINQNGKYNAYKAKFDLKAPTSKVPLNWKRKMATFLEKWWWLIPLPAILYDWLIR